MAEWVKVLATKRNDLSSIPGTHMVEGEQTQLSSGLHIHIPWHSPRPRINVILKNFLYKNKGYVILCLVVVSGSVLCLESSRLYTDLPTCP